MYQKHFLDPTVDNLCSSGEDIFFVGYPIQNFESALFSFEQIQLFKRLDLIIEALYTMTLNSPHKSV